MKKYTVEDILDIIEIEGLGYAVTNYLSADNIEDPELAALWTDAADLLERIAQYVGAEI